MDVFCLMNSGIASELTDKISSIVRFGMPHPRFVFSLKIFSAIRLPRIDRGDNEVTFHATWHVLDYL